MEAFRLKAIKNPTPLNELSARKLRLEDRRHIYGEGVPVLSLSTEPMVEHQPTILFPDGAADVKSYIRFGLTPDYGLLWDFHRKVSKSLFRKNKSYEVVVTSCTGNPLIYYKADDGVLPSHEEMLLRLSVGVWATTIRSLPEDCPNLPHYKQQYAHAKRNLLSFLENPL